MRVLAAIDQQKSARAKRSRHGGNELGIAPTETPQSMRISIPSPPKIETQPSDIHFDRPNIDSEPSSIDLETSDIHSETSNIESEASNIDPEKGNVESETANIESENSLNQCGCAFIPAVYSGPKRAEDGG